jgi:hypothetical protein
MCSRLRSNQVKDKECSTTLFFFIIAKQLKPNPINSVEYLIEVAFQEIPHPLDQIPPTPLDSNTPRSEPHSKSEGDEEENPHMAGNQNVILPWMSQGAGTSM